MRNPATGKKLKKFLLATFTGDPEAQLVIEDAFRVMLAPESVGGAGCSGELDALLGMARECISTYTPALKWARRA